MSADGTRRVLVCVPTYDEVLNIARTVQRIHAAVPDADVLVIATDVAHAVLHYGTPEASDVGTVDVATMRGYAAEGHFASGSMGPKVDAACRFVEQGGARSVITDLAHLADAVNGDGGTVVTAHGAGG